MKTIAWLIFLLPLLYSCQSSTDLKENKAIDHNTQVLRSLMDLWESGDTSQTETLFSEDCQYVDVPNQNTLSGIAGVNSYISHVHQWASSVRMEVVNVQASSSSGYAEWVFTANQTKPIRGRVPVATDKEVSLNGVTVVEFKDGKIQKASDYMDVLGFVIQLGARIELPGGVTIEQ